MNTTRAMLLGLLAALVGCHARPDVPSSTDRSSSATRIDLAKTNDALLQQHVGQKVTVLGRWDGRGKLSGYVYGIDGRKPIIYVKATGPRGLMKQSDFERVAPGTPVEVTGVLHFYESPPAPDNETVAALPAHFYFDVEEASVRFNTSP